MVSRFLARGLVLAGVLGSTMACGRDPAAATSAPAAIPVTTTTVQPKIVAPAQKDQAFGEIVVKLGEQEVSRTPLVALKEVPESGWFGRLIDSILMFFYYLFH